MKKQKFSPSQILILSFLSAIAVGTVLLMLPISTKSGSISFVDALFTATSAVCVTGLIVVDTGAYFTHFGQSVIMVLFQLGGLGIMTFTSLIFLLAGRSLGFTERGVIEESFTTGQGVNVKKFLIAVITFTFTLETIGGILLYFFDFKGKVSKPLFYSFFHSISAFNNAGFSLFSDSFVGYFSDVSLNLIIISLIVLGGIGFFVFYDIAEYLYKGRKYQRKIKLHTKVVLSSTLVLIFAGMGIFYLLENGFYLKSMSGKEKILVSLFQSVTPRTAGFNTADMTKLLPATTVLLMVLMFIGASPGSTGGGIKTTTISSILFFLRAKLKRRENVQVFSRNIPWEVIDKAHLIFIFSMVVLFSSTFLILVFEGSKFPLIKVLFEVISAYGTVGLSLGITSKLSALSKIVIIVTMFIGRVGIINMVYAFVKEGIGRFEYPEEKIMVG